MAPDSENQARQTINELLTAAGWAVQDYKSYDPGAARGIALREVPLKAGRCDYLLMVDRAAVGLIEAKREGTKLSAAAEQSAFYVANLPPFLQSTAELRFIYESTGAETFFRDSRDPEPRSRQLIAFHKPETLAQWAAEPDTVRARLRTLPPLVTGYGAGYGDRILSQFLPPPSPTRLRARALRPRAKPSAQAPLEPLRAVPGYQRASDRLARYHTRRPLRVRRGISRGGEDEPLNS